MDLKQLLIDIEDVDLDTLEEPELTAIIYEMLENLGSTDPELRDGLIYPLLVKIIESDILSPERLNHIMETCLDERHLFYRLGERGDSVFMRSFSSLAIAALLTADAEKPFLDRDIFSTITDKIIWYIEGETDTRGYVEEKGWAHSIAHSADMLMALVKNPSFSPNKFSSILNAIENCIFKENAAYVDGEDERLIVSIKTMIDKGLSDDVLDNWICRISKKLEDVHAAEGFSYKYYRNMMNLNNFMKSLYFRFKRDKTKMGIRVLLFDKMQNTSS